MAESCVRELLRLCLQRVAVEESVACELEFIQVAKNYEDVRKKWLQAEVELKKLRELLVKSDVARASLEVKLKHARNQVDVEMKKRYKAEADYQYLERQMQLMCDILVHDSKSSACLNDEQRSVLASFNHRGANVPQQKTKRLSVIDESSFLFHSDVSYDRSDDDLDLDSTVIKPLKSRAREKRRSSMGPNVGPPVLKRGRVSGCSGDMLGGRKADKGEFLNVKKVCLRTVKSNPAGGNGYSHPESLSFLLNISALAALMQYDVMSHKRAHPSVPHPLLGTTFLTACLSAQEVETTVVKASVTTPESGGQIHMVIDITKDSPDPLKTLRSEQLPVVAEQTSVWTHSDEASAESQIVAEKQVVQSFEVHQVFTPIDKTLKHTFLSKTVIRPETCIPCGKRIRFGKLAVKCRDCRLVAHPECSSLSPPDCSPSFPGPMKKSSEDTLESFAPLMQPRIPRIIVQCVNEIEKRGLEERGIYRVPGGERVVKELRDKYILGKGPLVLGKVEEIHAICGLLKDFLRKLREPLITFRLHRAFMDACEIEDEDASSALMFEAIGNLPQANRDTLAFLMLHLQKVMQSPQCQMDRNNLARVFGPTIVGHGMPEPSPLTIMKDTNAQPKVVARMLSFPAEYWKGLVVVERDRIISSVIDANLNNNASSTDRDRLFKPLTSPELHKCPKTPASGMLKGKIRNLGTAFNSTSKTKPDINKKKFFTSPS